MEKKYFTLSVFYFLSPLCAQAINVGEITSIITSDSNMLAKEVVNNTDAARFVTINVERISSPMAAGKIIPMEDKSELLFTPASQVMPGFAKDNFRFLYHGPQDDKERYYRLIWTDEPVVGYDVFSSKKTGQATTSATISTILVVTPRKEKFSFRHQGESVTNTGNVSFRVISYGPCKDPGKSKGNGCRERYYIMPGNTVKIKYTNPASAKTRIGIWHDGRYISVK